MILKEIKMEYVKVIDKAELPTNTMKIVVVDGKEVLLSPTMLSPISVLMRRLIGRWRPEGRHSHMPGTWCSIRCKDRQGCWRGEDRIYENKG